MIVYLFSFCWWWLFLSKGYNNQHIYDEMRNRRILIEYSIHNEELFITHSGFIITWNKKAVVFLGGGIWKTSYPDLKTVVQLLSNMIM